MRNMEGQDTLSTRTVQDASGTAADVNMYDCLLSEVGIGQLKDEILWFLGRTREFLPDPKVVVEIGSGSGGNLCMLSQLFASTDRLLIGVDSGTSVSNTVRRFLSSVDFTHIREDSHSSEAVTFLRQVLGSKKISVLFLDSDQCYEGICQDLVDYGPLMDLPSIVAFHDIASSSKTFWEELKLSGRYKYEEFFGNLDEFHAPPAPGIGILFLTDCLFEVKEPRVPTPVVQVPPTRVGVDSTSIVTDGVPVYLPFMGEFGSKLLKHAAVVYAMSQPKIVCHEVGEEAIYPGATERYIFERPDETGRAAGGHKVQQQVYTSIKTYYGEGFHYIDPLSIMDGRQRKFFVPQSESDYNVDFDILLLPRKKNYAAGRNWPFWSQFANTLAQEGYRIFLGGQQDSCEVMDYPAAWDFGTENTLDATIWALKKASLTIGSHTGTTVLSLMCGVSPWVIVSEKGYDAGESSSGLMLGFYEQADHLGVGWKIVPHWYDYQWIVKEVNDYMKCHREKDSMITYSQRGVTVNEH